MKKIYKIILQVDCNVLEMNVSDYSAFRLLSDHLVCTPDASLEFKQIIL